MIHKPLLTLVISSLYALCINAQQTHIIEPSILEISYHTTYKDMHDDYTLRVGKDVCQYFSSHKMYSDSLGSNKATAMIVLNEMLAEARNRSDKSKQRPHSPGHSDYIYRNLQEGNLTTYTQIFDSYYRIREKAPIQDWSLVNDTTTQIIGYTCHYATTRFRGRDWEIWYTEDIPLPLGPWKLEGLPGLILSATCKGYMSIVADRISTNNIPPITFYNFWGKKFEDIDRVKYLKVRNDPKSYPKGTKIKSTMELE